MPRFTRSMLSMFEITLGNWPPVCRRENMKGFLQHEERRFMIMIPQSRTRFVRMVHILWKF